jgi:hypothetical protein
VVFRPRPGGILRIQSEKKKKNKIREINKSLSFLSRATDEAKPLHDVAPVADKVEACSASANARNAHETDVVAPVASAGNGGRSPPPLCDNCGRPATNGQRWDWPGRPDRITLHSSCEVSWFDSEARQ